MALRRVVDVLLTLALCSCRRCDARSLRAGGITLNFANVVALPLLLASVLHSRFTTLWLACRKTGLLAIDPDQGRGFQRNDQRSGVREYVVVKLSSISSMGKLMALALLCTMAAAVLFQPVLMGPPRQIQNPSLRRSVAPSPAE